MKKPVDLQPPIMTIRAQRVILDADLAALYGVTTKALNQAVKRNASRFPVDFMFQLTAKEWTALRATPDRSQFATGYTQHADIESDATNRSQIVTGSLRHRDPRARPFAFTEHGAIMAASILNSPEAVAMSVYVVRAFVRMREKMAENLTILKRLAEIDKTLLEHDDVLKVLIHQLQPLLTPPPEPTRKKIGFTPDPS